MTQLQTSTFERLQESAQKQFEAKGFPHLKDEMWKYTNPAAFARKARPIPAQEGLSVSRDPAPGHTIRFVDGHVDVNVLKELNAEGVKLRFLSEGGAEVERHFQQVLKKGDGFQAMALAHLNNGLLVEISPDVKLDKPLHLDFIESGMSSEEGMFAPVCFITVGERASVEVIENVVSRGSSRAWQQPVTSYRLKDSASLQLLNVMDPGHDSQLLKFGYIEQAQDSHVEVLSVLVSGKISRNILTIDQQGERAFCRSNGLGLVRSGSHFDMRSLLLHGKASGVSHQLYKSVVSEKGRFVFNGKIYIAPNAQKVDSSMLNKNLLLGRMAEADTKPELEVYADDVKAGHGASIGQLDLSELFYLMSRGISKQKALELLAHGYVEELILGLKSSAQREFATLKLSEQVENLSRQIEASLEKEV